MKSALYLLLAASMMSSLFASTTPEFDHSRLFVKMKPGLELPKHNSLKAAQHLFGDVYVVSTDNLARLERFLQSHKQVAKVEKNYRAGKKKLPEVQDESAMKSFMDIYSNFNVFNDPLVSKIWSFQDSEENGVSVTKSYLSPLGPPRQEIIVAVVDTGVDYNHEDLKGVMWVNQGEIPGNGIDDDNNGYIDDVHGINFFSRDAQGRPSGNPMAGHPHGTHVAGTIAAEQNNGVGIAGIASNVKIMAIRAVPDDSDETDVDVVEAFLYAAKHGAKLINCSFGKDKNEGGMIVSEAIEYIGKTYGTLVLAAAGNDYGRNIDNNPAYPASYQNDNLLVVASTTRSGSMSIFSSLGKKSVDVAAPGSDIYSTINKNQYGFMSGTSMATPTTTGVAAKVLGHFPELGPVQLKQVLMDSVTKVKGFENKITTGGRVDLYQALEKALESL